MPLCWLTCPCTVEWADRVLGADCKPLFWSWGQVWSIRFCRPKDGEHRPKCHIFPSCLLEAIPYLPFRIGFSVRRIISCPKHRRSRWDHQSFELVPFSDALCPSSFQSSQCGMGVGRDDFWRNLRTLESGIKFKGNLLSFWGTRRGLVQEIIK